MPHDPKPTKQRRATALRGLDVGFAITAGVTLLGPVAAFLYGRYWLGILSGCLLGLIVWVWVLRGRRPADRRLAPLLLVAAAAFSFLPLVGVAAVLLVVFATLVVAFANRTRTALGLVVTYSVAFAVNMIITFEPTALDVVGQTGALLLLNLLGLAVGRLIHATEAARAEAAATGVTLLQANVRLQHALDVERELVLAEERARSARELHDGLGHRLTLVSMALEFAERSRGRDEQAGWAEIAHAAQTNRAALEDIRLWARALDPPVVAAGVSGVDAFDAIAATFRGTGLDVRVGHRGDPHPLAPDISLFTTRFIQEGLTNVLRHASAGRVDIEVLQSPAQLRLSLGDDGVGATATSDGYGLRSLRERARLIDGQVLVGHSALGGFELTAVLPLRRES